MSKSPNQKSSVNTLLNFISSSAKLSLYFNGRLLDGDPYYASYKSARILMLPLAPVALALGYKVKTMHAEGETILHSGGFKDFIVVRYLNTAENKNEISEEDITVFYYSHDKSTLSIDKCPEVKGGVLYAPIGFFKHALKLNVEISDSNNVIISEAE